MYFFLRKHLITNHLTILKRHLVPFSAVGIEQPPPFVEVLDGTLYANLE